MPAAAIWCGSDVITEAEYAALKHPNLSRSIYKLEDRYRPNDAISTMEEHHPGKIIWIESPESN